MSRRKIALFMTVGTGFGDDGAKKLAHGLYSSINSIRPDVTVFFASNDSLKTIEHLKKILKENNHDNFNIDEDYYLKIFSNIDDLSNCFNEIDQSMSEFEENYRIIVDYTSGTKTMSVAIASCAILTNKELYSVNGERENGIVSVGTETVKSQNAYSLNNKLLLNKIKNSFNNNRFEVAEEFLNEFISPKFDKNVFIDFLKGYNYFNNVNFNLAYEKLANLDLSDEIYKDVSKQFDLNRKALGFITSNHELKKFYILASLINNAKRSSYENKYDDAIARLYRSFELIAQLRLEEYNLSSSNIDIDILKEKNVSKDFIEDLEKIRHEGKIKIGLERDYLLLNELRDEIGKLYYEKGDLIKNMTMRRNNSILAHGLESQNKDAYFDFEEIVISFARKLEDRMDIFLEETKFPNF